MQRLWPHAHVAPAYSMLRANCSRRPLLCLWMRINLHLAGRALVVQTVVGCVVKQH